LSFVLMNVVYLFLALIPAITYLTDSLIAIALWLLIVILFVIPDERIPLFLFELIKSDV
jgi:hypothetical protein